MALRNEMVAAIRAGGTTACLATVVVGDNPRCHIFARDKRAAAAEAGMRGRNVDLPASAGQQEVDDALAALAADADVHGIIVQLPLPQHLHLQPLPPAKDVDGTAAGSRHTATTPLAVICLLDRHGIPVEGRAAVVVGDVRGMVEAFERRGATVTVVGQADPDACREADILVAAAGRPGSIGPDHVRPGATVVDVTGVVDLAGVEAVAGTVAPYPTGVGPVAVACLLRNTVDAAKLVP